MRWKPSHTRRVVALLVAALGALALAAPGSAQLVLVDSHQFTWTDPASGGVVLIREEVYRGCSDGHANEMTFKYHVLNQSYSPAAGNNGLSGFQIVFPAPIPEVHNQVAPTTGGPWDMNAFSGIGPPNGLEWDVENDDGNGILVGQTGDFSYCTGLRDDVVVNSPPANPSGNGPNGWAHTWVGNVQQFLFNGPNSVPGRLLLDLGTRCSDRDLVCKSVTAKDADGDGIIELGEETVFTFVITVENPGPGTWTNVTVKDNLAGDIELHSATPSQGIVTPTLTGKSEKVHLLWTVGSIPAGGSASLVLVTSTDENPAGHQEFTSCGVHELNSGATLKFIAGGHQSSAGTGGISTRIWCRGTVFAATDEEEFQGEPLPDRLARMETLGPFVQSTTIETADRYVNGMESNGAGNLFTGNVFTNELNVLTPTGALISSVATPMPVGECCNEDIAFDGANLWRAKWPSGPLNVFTPAGALVTSYVQSDVVGATFVGPTLWLSKWSAQQVGTFNPGTNSFTPVFSTASLAGGLAYDSSNNLLWVGRQGGDLEAWSLDGAVPALVAGSGTQPFGPIGDTIDGVAFIGS